MAKSEYIGLIDCPMCGNQNATVHEQATGNKKGARYFRCYTEILGTKMRCGTIQAIGPEGQVFINGKMRPLEPTVANDAEFEPEQKPVLEPIASNAPAFEPEPEAEPIAESKPVPKRAWGGFIKDLLTEE